MEIIKLHKSKGERECIHLIPSQLANQLEYAKKHGITCFIQKWDRHDNEGVNNLSFLQSVRVQGLIVKFEGIDHHSIINEFKDLEIFIAGMSEPNSTIDFTNFPSLKHLNIRWNKYYNSLENLKKLISLDLWYYKPKSRNLNSLRSMQNLSNLTLVMASIDSLDGIQKLENLREIRIANNRTIKSFFSNVSTSKLKLIDLWIETCKNLDLETLPKIETVKILRLIDIGKINTLKNILNKFPNIESLVFTQSELMDGDIEYLLNIPSLKRVTIDNKKHYSLKEKDIKEILQSRNSQ